MAEPVTVKLRNPIDWGKGNRIDELVLRPITGRDMRKLPRASEMDICLELAARLSGQPEQVIDQLVGEDLGEVLAAVAGFMERSLLTGSAA